MRRIRVSKGAPLARDARCPCPAPCSTPDRRESRNINKKTLHRVSERKQKIYFKSDGAFEGMQYASKKTPPTFVEKLKG
jgi:hypothetical protein